MKPAFVISPIGRPGSRERTDADDVFATFIEPPARRQGFSPYRGDHVSVPGMIVAQVCVAILRDELIFAYLKGRNPNVFYELAVAHALRKPVILLKPARERIPFDLGGARIIPLRREDIAGCHRQIEDQITALAGSSASSTSPVQLDPAQVLACVLPRSPRFAGGGCDISGVWTGFTIETFPAGSDAAYQKYHAEMRLSCSGGNVTGSVQIAYGDDFDQPARNTALLHLYGAFRPPRFVRLHYDNDRVPHHCGLLFLEILPGSLEAVGTFAGYGIASAKPVHGRITMRRAEPGAT